MKKDLNVYNLAVFSQLEPQSENHRLADPEPEFDDTMLKNILDEIFVVDENSGFPKGDIQYYLSSSGNPAVKQWLENNIFKPRFGVGGSSLDGLTDDMIAEFGRQPGESVSDYQQRLFDIRQSALEEYQRNVNVENKSE